MGGWIGVDLDGTLAHYDSWRGVDHVGAPIPLMVDRVKKWIAEGKEVRILTARLTDDGDAGKPRFEEAKKARAAIEVWCLKHIGKVLQVTNRKDFGMMELWDDRAVQVIPNTGRTIADELQSERAARSGKGV